MFEKLKKQKQFKKDIVGFFSNWGWDGNFFFVPDDDGRYKYYIHISTRLEEISDLEGSEAVKNKLLPGLSDFQRECLYNEAVKERERRSETKVLGMMSTMQKMKLKNL